MQSLGLGGQGDKIMNILASDLSMKFDDVLALDSISFSTNSNRLAIIGQNGSGKTTLLSLIAGLLKPTSGHMAVNDFDPYKSRKRAINSVSFMFEKIKFPYRIKVREFIDFLEMDHSGKDKEELVSAMGIDSLLEKRMYSLSSGEEQILSILNLLCSPTDILLLDEPFTHLDIFRISRIYKEIVDLKQDIIITTHIPEEAESIGEFFIIIDKGKIVWKGSKQDLINSDIFEVYAAGTFPDSLKIIYRYGSTALVRSPLEDLYDLVKEQKIIGFRKSGVRRVYNEIDESNKMVF